MNIHYRKKIHKTSTILIVLCLVIAIAMPSTLADGIQKESNADSIQTANTVTAKINTWGLSGLAEDQLNVYNAAYRVTPEEAATNGGKYGSNTLDKAWDESISTYWESGKNNNDTRQIYIEYTFAQPEEISRIVYGSRPDASNKGFAKKFEIWGRTDTEAPYTLVTEGSHATTGELLEISFPTSTFQQLKFVWTEVEDCGLGIGHQLPSARVMWFYKEDNLPNEVMGLFTDSAATALMSDADMAKVQNLKKKLETYPLPDSLKPYLNLAEDMLSGTVNNALHDAITLSQRGQRASEASRSANTFHLGNYDLTGYYARPGEVLRVFAEIAPDGPAPRLVLATVGENPWSWARGYDGQILKNGYNLIQVPQDMKGCQAIYFYNPALPDAQAYAPVVRLEGGTKYPVYFYDSKDDIETTRAKEAAFLEELNAYVNGVTDISTDAQSGSGFYNMCEFYSDKVIVSTSARGAKIGVERSGIWDKGDWADYVNRTRYGVVQYDDDGQANGILYRGPAAAMECYEMLYDDLSLYSGYNITNPAGEDYRNHNQFLFRAYSDGSGEGWGQSVYAGFNTGTSANRGPNDSRANSYYVSLASVSAVLGAGWTIYHEIGHVFDSGIIGVSESTNNLYATMAQDKFLGSNRLANPGENRWYKHFTTYINTGLLPYNDRLFYPGAVTYQLDAVDFSDTKIYNDEGVSNYGLACRYARLHRSEIKDLSKNDKLVLSMSMGCGVDLTDHFEYYGRPVSSNVKQLVSGLPKETRPTWFVNDRTFAGSEFSAEDRAKSPIIDNYTIDASTGAVTLEFSPNVFTTPSNLQCFSIYRQDVKNGQPVGEPVLIGITGDDKTTKNIDELYRFVDKDVMAGHTYCYTIGAYDCSLIENEAKATQIVTIGEEITVPISGIRINDGADPLVVSAGKTLPVQLHFYPSNATVDLNTVEWWAEGWGRDNAHNGSGEKTVVLQEDPAYPGDPTRRIITAIANGQSFIKVRVGTIPYTVRIEVGGSTADLNAEKYDLEFEKSDLSLAVGQAYPITIKRTTKSEGGNTTPGQVVDVIRFPGTVTWISSNPEVVAVAQDTNTDSATKKETLITAKGAGTATVSCIVNGMERASCTVNVAADAVPLTDITLSGETIVSVGKTAPLTYKLAPSDATVTEPVTWVSSDPSIARVDDDGLVTGVSQGNAVITASIGGISAQHSITVPEYVPLRSISLSQAELTLTKDSPTAQILLTKEPANASADAAAWSSSNSDIVTVDQTGTVTAVGAGSATITASIEGRNAVCTVTSTLIQPLEGLQFKGQAIGADITETMTVGGTKQLMVYPVPLQAGGLSSVRWTTSMESVAVVKEGYITAVGPGETTITASITQTDENGTEISSFDIRCLLTVNDNIRPLTGLGISHSSQGLWDDESFVLSTVPRPINANRSANGVDPLGITVYSSSNPDVVTVDQNGLVAAVGEGNAVVTAVQGGLSAECTVSVRKRIKPIESIVMDKSILTLRGLGSVHQLGAAITPEDAGLSIVWFSSDSSVVEVDWTGRLTAVGEGTAVVTASAGGKHAECEVTVTEDKNETVVLSVSETTGGTVSVYNSVTGEELTDGDILEKGTIIRVTLTPNEGYKAEELLVNGTVMTSGVLEGDIGVVTYDDITADTDMIINADFTQTTQIINIDAATSGVVINSNVERDVMVTKASYDEQGILLEVEMLDEVKINIGANKIPFANTPNLGDKIFVWDGVVGMNPLCETKVVSQ